MRRATAPFVLVALIVLACTAPLAQAAPHVRFFLSPDHNISCELDAGRAGVPDRAYCQSLVRPSSATLGTNGHYKACKGQGCLGNPPENDPTLKRGGRVALGPFECTAGSWFVICTTRTRGGFEITRYDVTAVLALPPKG